MKKLKVEEKTLYIYLNNVRLEVALLKNSSVTALMNYLANQDIIIKMNDYGKFEKVGNLNFKLPQNDSSIKATFGDIILYQGNYITIY